MSERDKLELVVQGEFPPALVVLRGACCSLLGYSLFGLR